MIDWFITNLRLIIYSAIIVLLIIFEYICLRTSFSEASSENSKKKGLSLKVVYLLILFSLIIFLGFILINYSFLKTSRPTPMEFLLISLFIINLIMSLIRLIIVNHATFYSLIKPIAKLLGIKTSQPKQSNKISVIYLLVQQKVNANINALTIIIITAAIYNFLGKKYNIYSPIANIMFAATALLICLNTLITWYRMKKGYYGYNDYESREIIQFIMDNSDTIGPSGGKTLPLFPEHTQSVDLYPTASRLERS